MWVKPEIHPIVAIVDPVFSCCRTDLGTAVLVTGSALTKSSFPSDSKKLTSGLMNVHVTPMRKQAWAIVHVGQLTHILVLEP